jgi:hypothetical protein
MAATPMAGKAFKRSPAPHAGLRLALSMPTGRRPINLVFVK